MSDNSRKFELSDINAIMSTEAGIQFINRLIDQTGMFKDVYNNDSLENAKNSGRRQIGVWLFNELQESGDLLKLIKFRELQNDR